MRRIRERRVGVLLALSIGTMVACSTAPELASTTMEAKEGS